MGQSEHSKDLGSLSTVHLLNEAKSGSLEAREALVARYLPRLQKWARGRLPSSARGVLETDNIVQDTLLQTLHNLDAFDPEHSGAFRGYVRRAAQNRIFDEYRRVSRRPSADQSAGGIAHPGPSPLEAAIGKERVENYEAALEASKTARPRSDHRSARGWHELFRNRAGARDQGRRGADGGQTCAFSSSTRDGEGCQ